MYVWNEFFKMIPTNLFRKQTETHTHRKPTHGYQMGKGKLKVKLSVMSDFWYPHENTVQGIHQARILEWIAFSVLQGDLPHPGIEPRSPTLQVDLYQQRHQGSPGGKETGINYEFGINIYTALYKTNNHQGLTVEQKHTDTGNRLMVAIGKVGGRMDCEIWLTDGNFGIQLG